MALVQMMEQRMPQVDQLLTVEDVAVRLNVSTDWLWDHSSPTSCLSRSAGAESDA
jgi:hypothetical protein